MVEKKMLLCSSIFFPLNFLLIYILFIEIEFFFCKFHIELREMIMKLFLIIIFDTMYDAFLDYVNVHLVEFSFFWSLFSCMP